MTWGDETFGGDSSEVDLQEGFDGPTAGGFLGKLLEKHHYIPIVAGKNWVPFFFFFFF